MRLRPLTTAAAIMLMASALPAAAGQGDGRPDHARDQMLERPMHGEEAVQTLGDRLPEAAQLNDMNPGRFQGLLRSDLDFWVNEEGRLFAVDTNLVDEHTDQAEPGEPEQGNAPYSQTFLLHSKPGSNRVIHLDFDGYSLPAGTGWNSGLPLTTAAYDTDGNPNNWTNAEMDVVQAVWERVAEDFAPFDVDVTTQDPGFDAIHRSNSSDQQFGTRVVISDDHMLTMCPPNPPSSGGGCGGVAYVGVFDHYGNTYGHDRYQPAWVFVEGVGPGPKNIAEAASHEAGHNLGLSHDGGANSVTSCSNTTAYYCGHGNWAPIMGVGYYKAVTQWSQGEYAGATETENDLNVIQVNGALLRGDDHGDNVGSGTTLTAPAIAASGTITNRNDVDVFTFEAGAGLASITVDVAATGPNLDVQADLLDAAGNVLTSANGSGLGASLSWTLPATGTYALRVDGVGSGTASTGYNDYGSLGNYTVSGTVPTAGPTSNEPPTAVAGASPSSGTAPLAVSFSSTGSGDTDGTIVAYDWDFGDGNTGSGPSPSHTYTSNGSFTASLTVQDDEGATDSATVLITVEAPANKAPTATASASPTSGEAPLSVQFTGTGSDADGDDLTYFWDFGDTATSTEQNPAHTYTTPGAHYATLTVSDGTDTASDTVIINVSAAPAPDAPSSLTVGDGTDGTAQLSWTGAGDWFELQRERQHPKNGKWSGNTVLNVGSGTSYTDPVGAGTYRYKIRACNSSGCSGWYPSASDNWVVGSVTDTSGGGGGGNGGNGKGGGKPPRN